MDFLFNDFSYFKNADFRLQIAEPFNKLINIIRVMEC